MPCTFEEESQFGTAHYKCLSELRELIVKTATFHPLQSSTPIKHHVVDESDAVNLSSDPTATLCASTPSASNQGQHIPQASIVDKTEVTVSNDTLNAFSRGFRLRF